MRFRIKTVCFEAVARDEVKFSCKWIEPKKRFDPLVFYDASIDKERYNKNKVFAISGRAENDRSQICDFHSGISFRS